MSTTNTNQEAGATTQTEEEEVASAGDGGDAKTETKSSSDGKNSDSKEQKIYCYACYTELKRDHHGIKCCSDHHLCAGDCSKNFIQNHILEPMRPAIPPMCLMGGGHEVIMATLEMNMQPDQYLHWQKILSTHARYQKLCPGEELVECPSCDYVEFHITGAGFNQMFCRNAKCKKVSCKYCKEEMWMPKEEDRGKLQSEADYMKFLADQEKHSDCATLGPCRQSFMNAIHEGMNATCPSCGHFGRKDEACTHMTCPVCNTRYCYICEEAFVPADRVMAAQRTHKADWEKHEGRCPMYMYHLHRHDKRYPSSNNDALNFYHRLKTIGLLQKAIQSMGKTRFDKVWDRFSQVRNAGFTKEEIYTTDPTLIVTDNRPSTWQAPNPQENQV